MEHSHVWMSNLDDWRSGEKEIGCFRNVVLQKNDEYQMGGYRITNEKVLERVGERRSLRKSLRKRRGQMMGHTLRHGCLGISSRGRWGKIRGRGRPRLEYFDQIIGDMRCETFREVKELTWDRAELRRVVVSNQS